MARRVLDSGINLTRGQRRQLTGAATPAEDAGDVSAQIANLTVAQVLDKVQAGELNASGVLAAERAGKARSSLVAALERAIAD